MMKSSIYIAANTDAVKDDIALMVADNPVPAKVQEYALPIVKMMKINDMNVRSKYCAKN